MSTDLTFEVPPGGSFAWSLEKPQEPKASFNNFAFVMNVSSLVGVDKFILQPGHELRRATHEEIAKIKELLGASDGGLLGLGFYPWEFQKQEDGSWTPLPEHEWRYFVISFQGSNQIILDLEYALCLTKLELQIAFAALGKGHMHHPGRLFQMLDKADLNSRFFDVTPTDAEEIAIVCDQLRTHDPATVDMIRVAAQLLDFEALPSRPPSRFLAYFGILESLLTHSPQPKDPYDSITRQVKKKLALLDHRWNPSIDYGGFPGKTHDSVWGQMYGYRSCLAHGGTPDFKRELSGLGDPGRAMDLLKWTVKAVCRQALIEPQLIADLKDC